MYLTILLGCILIITMHVIADQGSGTEPTDVTSHRHVSLINEDGCGVPMAGRRRKRIIGGVKTDELEFPWTVYLVHTNLNKTTVSCGGTLINKYYVLTAATCLEDRAGWRLLSVHLGEKYTVQPEECSTEEGGENCSAVGRIIPIASKVQHPAYDSRSYANNIGIIRLRSPIQPYTNTIKPICLPVGLAAQNKNLDGMRLTATGQGRSSNNINATESYVLRKVTVPVVSLNECKKQYEGGRHSVTHTQVCAGATNQGSCIGDSGGPLQDTDASPVVQYGVASFGPVICGRENIPDVYTRVGHYMDWILDKMRPFT